jgi:nucleotide-binding universal stress UspA family protein
MPGAPGEAPRADIEGAAKTIVEDARSRVPSDVEAQTQIANEHPARALIHASETADLLVIGSRGMGGFRGLLLGSVSQQVLHHARCPTVLIPHEGRSAT